MCQYIVQFAFQSHRVQVPTTLYNRACCKQLSRDQLISFVVRVPGRYIGTHLRIEYPNDTRVHDNYIRLVRYDCSERSKTQATPTLGNAHSETPHYLSSAENSSFFLSLFLSLVFRIKLTSVRR